MKKFTVKADGITKRMAVIDYPEFEGVGDPLITDQDLLESVQEFENTKFQWCYGFYYFGKYVEKDGDKIVFRDWDKIIQSWRQETLRLDCTSGILMLLLYTLHKKKKLKREATAEIGDTNSILLSRNFDFCSSPGFPRLIYTSSALEYRLGVQILNLDPGLQGETLIELSDGRCIGFFRRANYGFKGVGFLVIDKAKVVRDLKVKCDEKLESHDIQITPKSVSEEFNRDTFSYKILV